MKSYTKELCILIQIKAFVRPFLQEIITLFYLIIKLNIHDNQKSIATLLLTQKGRDMF